MNWFEQLFGFCEGAYAETQARFDVQGSTLASRVNGRRFGIGRLELVSLQTLRDRMTESEVTAGRLKVQIVRGDVGQMHLDPAHRHAVFQVASQFNLLEMIEPNVSPEDGVTCYERDRTQGPACAIAAGAATVYRNYFVPIAGELGQTRTRQLDGLSGLGAALSEMSGLPVSALWDMRNGYALCTSQGLAAIEARLGDLDETGCDALRARLCIGVHSDVEVTLGQPEAGITVTQAFCSALPVAYCRFPQAQWARFATLVLEAAYEATLWAAVANARRGRSNTVLLTRLGGGAFGNNDAWIHSAMQRALAKAQGFELDVRLVSYGPPSRDLMSLAEAHA